MPGRRLPRRHRRRSRHSRPHHGHRRQLRHGTAKLCLEGDAVKDQDGADDGQLCGTLSRTPNSSVPAKGDDFRFVSVRTSGEVDGKTQQQVVIYGDVVD